MKKVLFFAMAVVCAGFVRAGEVKGVKAADGLVVEKGYDKFYAGNVVVNAASTSRSSDFEKARARGYRVEITGNKAASSMVEFYYSVKLKGGGTAILVAGRGVVKEGPDTFDFVVPGWINARVFGTWFVRVVNEGRIVGVAGLTAKAEEMAGNPSTSITYGVNDPRVLEKGGESDRR